jgi:Zinc finger, ZZ type
VVKLLLENGADISLSNTLLGLVAMLYREECIEVVIKYGATPFLLDCYGRTALDWTSLYPLCFAKMGNFVNSYKPTPIYVQQKCLWESVQSATQMLKTSEPGKTYLWARLGHRLLFLHDDASVSISFHQCCTLDSKIGEQTHGARCNLCSTSISGIRYICKTCPEFDLCTLCMSE